MQIGNQFLTGGAVPVFRPTPAGKAGTRKTRRTRSAETASELSHWLELTLQEPEVRDTVVDQARQRWASGFYGSDEAAFQTAAALLSADG
ncbi:MAG: hypothetical protein U0793_30960 [Gemmataceae bacterium]